ncbi:MAG: NAD-binding protein [Acidobacteria bacterium RIFCSPLOWO2_02_FULL_67_36]|nr:MAG: NAD-binding protein [Acidobacteria bacterium RIFCSPLOWO2_02_FULL_67_36]OFW21727.1 MAG: NAD-binding protein [Acidobacteria bacterium RIFCSPLOWO2_12_FULL_66_21]
MAERVRWGVLGVARIATLKVIPAMQAGQWTEVAAIASRDIMKARAAAGALHIPKAYGSYEELLADPDIDAIYNPLPNHLHVPWTIRAAQARKHVLCEKPIALNADEAAGLIAVRDAAGVLIQEAFMVRTHPQWQRAKELVRSGRIGPVRSIVGVFSYFNDDPTNIRNIPEWGGGGIMDIGCYLIHTARFILDREPLRVAAAIERDPSLRVDRLASMVLDFGDAQVTGTCATQTVPWQRVQILGTRGRIEIEIPFNALPDRPSRIFVDDGSDIAGAGIETMALPAVNQYTIQADLFSRAILDGAPAPYPLEDSIRNMRVIDAVFRAAESGQWEIPA